MTRSLTRTLAIACLIASALLAAPSASSAKTLIGLGDQNAYMLSSARFKELKIKRVRIVVPWNVALARRDRAFLDSWLKEARAAHVEALVHFASTNGTRCPARPCNLPTVKAFTKAFRAFRKRYGSLRVIGVWNEANHRSQPTFKNPARAAQFFNVVRKYCRGCKIVAADVIDETNLARWLAVFKRNAHGPRIWGLHNYRDTNPRKGQKYGGTRQMLQLVRGEVWATETGGIVKFILPGGGRLFPFSEARANTAVRRMLNLARRYSSRIKRLYVYNWAAPLPSNRFDSGLLRYNLTPRPAYFTLQRALKFQSRYFAP